MPVPGSQEKEPSARAWISPCFYRKCSLRTALIDHGYGLSRSASVLCAKLAENRAAADVHVIEGCKTIPMI